MRNEIINFLLESEEDDLSGLLKDVSGPSESDFDDQLRKLLPETIRKKEAYLNKPCTGTVRYTNPHEETYIFGFFGSGKNRVTSTLLYLDPTRGWVSEDSITFHESVKPRIRGEYWITPEGVMFADGDVGEMNHEGYAIDHARRKILELLGEESDDEYVDEDSFEEKVISGLEDQGIYADVTTWSDLAIDFLRRTYPDDSSLYPIFQAALGRGDARDVAVRYFGWIWCRGNNLSIWKYDRDYLLRGIQEVIGQESDYDADWDTLDLEIYIASRGRHTSITFGELEAGGHPTQDFSWPTGDRPVTESEDDFDLRDLLPSDSERYLPMGTISRGTAHESDLIPEFIQALSRVDAEEADGLSREFEALHPEDYPYFCWEKLFNRLNRHVPPFAYFGSSEGAGTDYGVWPNNEAINDALVNDDDVPEELQEKQILKVQPGSTLPLGRYPYILKTNQYDYPEALLDGNTGHTIWEIK